MLADERLLEALRAVQGSLRTWPYGCHVRPLRALREGNTVATTADHSKRLDLYVANLDCEHDAGVIERGLDGVPGIIAVQIYPQAAKVALTYDPERVSDEALKEQLQALGFPLRQGRTPAGPPKLWRNPKVVTSALSGLLLLLGWLLSLANAPPVVSTLFYLASLGVGGYYFGREAAEELVFERRIGIELLMSVAAITATLLGLPAEGATLAFLYSISEAAEGYTEEKTRSAIKALMDLTPKMAIVRRDGGEVEIPVEELVIGDVFVMRPGQSAPTDGTVLSGSSSVNQAPVTGESVPVEKQPGDVVFAGSINGEGALQVRATTAFATNTIARIIQMVEEAQEQKGKSQRFIEKFGARYSPAVLLAGVVIAVVPPLLFHASWLDWLTRATVFIVAAAPCALVISIPITLVATLGTGARHGVLVKGGVYIEELAKITVVALDKTGTITRGEPEVTDVLLCGHSVAPRITSSQTLLAFAAGIEQHSEHPLARAIVRYAEAHEITPTQSADVRALPGAGAMARLDGTSVYVGSPHLFGQELGVSLEAPHVQIAQLQGEGKTVIVVGDEREPWGLIAIRDSIRPNARSAIEAVRRGGVEHVVMLTGDNERAAQAIAHEAGVDLVYADLKPEDKVKRIRELAQQYGRVAMVGDGVNDAPALAEATIGIAMGAAGTDVALETADVALMSDDLDNLAYALRLAKRNQSVVRQNLALSALVVGTLVIGAVLGVFSLPIAVLAHEISEFVVIGSGLRMLRP